MCTSDAVRAAHIVFNLRESLDSIDHNDPAVSYEDIYYLEEQLDYAYDQAIELAFQALEMKVAA